jgi:hypothetical protein
LGEAKLQVRNDPPWIIVGTRVFNASNSDQPLPSVSEASSIVASFVVTSSSSSSLVGVGCFGRFGDGREVVVVVVVDVPTETPSLLWNSLLLLIVDGEGLKANGSAVSVSVLNSKAMREKQLRLWLCR